MVGELGNGTTATWGGLSHPAALSSGVTMISGSQSAEHYDHTCAVVSGAALCWGGNNFGEIGDGTMIGRPSPTQVLGLTSGVLEIGVGWAHTCALLSTGAVQCWGANASGELGDGTTNPSPTPVPVSGLTTGVTAIAVGGNFSCALLGAEGAVRCWGDNTVGSLGDGTTTMRLVPTPVSGLTSGVTNVSAGNGHACATVGETTKCWGYNISGQTGPTSNLPSCYATNPCNTVPVMMPQLTSGVASSIAANDAACAILTTGGVACWGRNLYGKLGDGTTIDSPDPVQVADFTSGVTSIGIGYRSGCAVRDESIYCWGDGFYGNVLGGSISGSTLTPVLVQPWQ